MSKSMATLALRRSIAAPSPLLFAVRSYATTTAKDPILLELQKNLKDAMRAKDSLKASVLKSAIGDLNYHQHEKNPPPAITTLLSSLSKRKEALKMYAAQDRSDLVEQFQKEISILESFIPEDARELSELELSQLVKSVIEELFSAATEGGEAARKEKTALNKVIKEVRNRAGMRAQNLGKQISQSAKEALGQ